MVFLWCESYVWHPFKYYKSTWNTTPCLNKHKHKHTSPLLTFRRQNSNICLCSTQNKRCISQTCNNHAGDHKGAAFPLKKSKLIGLQSSQQGNFPAPPKRLKSTCGRIQPITRISLATSLHVGTTKKWCVLANFHFNYSLFAIKFSSTSSEVDDGA